MNTSTNAQIQSSGTETHDRSEQLLVKYKVNKIQIAGFHAIGEENELPIAYVDGIERARLFAAAPDLLAALKACFKPSIAPYGPSCPLCHLEIAGPNYKHSEGCLVGAAIAKAEGGAA